MTPSKTDKLEQTVLESIILNHPSNVESVGVHMPLYGQCGLCTVCIRTKIPLYNHCVSCRVSVATDIPLGPVRVMSPYMPHTYHVEAWLYPKWLFMTDTSHSEA